MVKYKQARTMARDLRKRGMSYAQISRALADAGHVTMAGKPFALGTMSNWFRRLPGGPRRKKYRQTAQVQAAAPKHSDLIGAIIASNLRDADKLALIDLSRGL